MTKKQLEAIRKRMDRAEIQPWRVEKGKYGCSVIEPYAVWGRHDVLIASNLDGLTAAFLASVPDDMRDLLRYVDNLERQISEFKKKKRKLKKAR